MQIEARAEENLNEFGELVERYVKRFQKRVKKFVTNHILSFLKLSSQAVQE